LGVHSALSNIPIDHALQLCGLVNNKKFVNDVFNMFWMVAHGQFGKIGIVVYLISRSL
jgi:hypothetical protein